MTDGHSKVGNPLSYQGMNDSEERPSPNEIVSRDKSRESGHSRAD